MSDNFSFGDLVFADEENGVGPVDAEMGGATVLAHTLGKATKFFGAGCLPHRFGVGAGDEFAVWDRFASLWVDDFIDLMQELLVPGGVAMG